ncbi:MAG: hypothetical protein JO015_02015 [Verrucomicrobia bacterium]|nr:hypothetical protein [Verrucomicrobiota bacterium]
MAARWVEQRFATTGATVEQGDGHPFRRSCGISGSKAVHVFDTGDGGGSRL